MPNASTAVPRKLFMLLSARSLSYSRCCILSLARNAIEPIDVTLITDGPEDEQQLAELIAPLNTSTQAWRVFGQAEADRRAETIFAAYPAIREFRMGHPCWRKITDPPLFCAEGDEMVILDPDVYFPNRFTFEQTPDRGLLLMWQQPNCLLPEDITRRAFEAGIPMADHTDIGVALVRNTLDWAAMERWINDLGGADLPRSMHVESIIWAAFAMHMGGGYLDPARWHCHRNTILSRLARKLGKDGAASLRDLPIASLKCLHGGGAAKNWFPKAEQEGILTTGQDISTPSPIRPYAAYSRAKFERKFAIRRWAERLGLYRLMGS